jgi:hypothetical protein
VHQSSPHRFYSRDLAQEPVSAAMLSRFRMAVLADPGAMISRIASYSTWEEKIEGVQIEYRGAASYFCVETRRADSRSKMTAVSRTETRRLGITDADAALTRIPSSSRSGAHGILVDDRPTDGDEYLSNAGWAFDSYPLGATEDFDAVRVHVFTLLYEVAVPAMRLLNVSELILGASAPQ